jgi:hypothetical protein
VNKYIVLAIILMGSALANWAVYHDLTQPAPIQLQELPPPQPGIENVSWSIVEKTTVHNGKPQFDQQLRQLEGKRVQLPGVLFVLKPLVVDGKVTGAILMPPSKLTCCGVTCDPKQELMVYVDCESNPFPLQAKKELVIVVGSLKLHDSDSTWGLYSLENAVIKTAPK